MKTIYILIFCLTASVSIGQIKVQRYEVSFMDMKYYSLKNSDSTYLFKLNYDFVKVDSGSFLIAYIIDAGSTLFVKDTALKFFRSSDTIVLDKDTCQPYLVYESVIRNGSCYLQSNNGKDVKLFLNEKTPSDIIPFIKTGLGMGIDKVFTEKYQMKYIGEFSIDKLDL